MILMNLIEPKKYHVIVRNNSKRLFMVGIDDINCKVSMNELKKAHFKREIIDIKIDDEIKKVRLFAIGDKYLHFQIVT